MRALVRANPSPRLWSWIYRRRDANRISSLLPAILATIPQRCAASKASSWQVHGVRRTETGMTVASLGVAGHAPAAILRLPWSADDTARLRRHNDVLVTLHRDARLRLYSGLLPEPLAFGVLGEQSFAVEQALDGRSGTDFLLDRPVRVQLLRAAALAIGELHNATSTPTLITNDLLGQWIDRRLDLMMQLIAPQRSAVSYAASLSRLARYIRVSLLGRRLSVGWIHGDFWLGNLLTTGDGSTVTGIVDWEWAADEELPAHDILHLLLYTRCLVEHRDLGHILCELLNGAPWPPDEAALLKELQGGVFDDAVARALCLLYWLRHITSNIEQSMTYINHRRWFENNVASILRLF